jgi:hypothetical protein
MDVTSRVILLLVEDNTQLHTMTDGVLNPHPYYGAYCFVDVSGDPPVPELLDAIARKFLDFLTQAEGRPVLHVVVLGSNIAEREKTIALMRESDRMQDRFPELAQARRGRGESDASSDCLFIDFLDESGACYNNHCCLPASQLTDGYDYEPWTEIPAPTNTYDDIIRGNPVLRLQRRALDAEVVAAARKELARLAGEGR